MLTVRNLRIPVAAGRVEVSVDEGTGPLVVVLPTGRMEATCPTWDRLRDRGVRLATVSRPGRGRTTVRPERFADAVAETLPRIAERHVHAVVGLAAAQSLAAEVAREVGCDRVVEAATPAEAVESLLLAR